MPSPRPEVDLRGQSEPLSDLASGEIFGKNHAGLMWAMAIEPAAFWQIQKPTRCCIAYMAPCNQAFPRNGGLRCLGHCAPGSNVPGLHTDNFPAAGCLARFCGQVEELI